MSDESTKSAHLEDIPASPHELEDYVAALFQTAGYYVEKNIVERDPTDILELDVVATRYPGEGPPETVLAEVKSGGWGFPDMFKLCGWMTYLGIPTGVLFATRESDHLEPAFVEKKIGRLGVGLVQLADFSQPVDRFRAAGFPGVDDPVMFAVWRFSYWIERTLVTGLRRLVREKPDRPGLAATLQYHRLVNDSIFFENDVRYRLDKLYDAYKDHPRLTRGLALEIAGGTFDPHSDAREGAGILRGALLYGRHFALQCSMYLEHRARLAILKALIDLICLEDAGQLPQPATGNRSMADLFYQLLPKTYHDAVKRLRKHEHVRRYALFWQVFLWGFGGFYLGDRRDEEFEALAGCTGIPVDQIPKAIEAYDILFPTSGSWIVTPEGSECVLVKMVPNSFRGIGAHQRRLRHQAKDVGELGYTGLTVTQLAGWINTGVELLTS